MESVIRRGVHFGYCTTNQAPLAELAAVADETLFEHILRNKQRHSGNNSPPNVFQLYTSKRTCFAVINQSNHTLAEIHAEN